VIYRLGEDRPKLEGEGHFIAPSASVIGAVVLGERVSVWHNAVIRGDLEHIVVGDETNIQDGAVLHTDHGMPVVVGRGVIVGHLAVLHGCTVGDVNLIGIHAVVLSGATIGSHCIVGANALVPEGATIPDRSLVLGTPARVIRPVTAEEIVRIEEGAAWYVRTAERYLAEADEEAGRIGGG